MFETSIGESCRSIRCSAFCRADESCILWNSLQYTYRCATDASVLICPTPCVSVKVVGFIHDFLHFFPLVTMVAPKLIPLILSGGAGTRLWPLSREAAPKPFMLLPD